MAYIAIDACPGCEDIFSCDHGFSEPCARAGGLEHATVMKTSGLDATRLDVMRRRELRAFCAEYLPCWKRNIKIKSMTE